ncbi:MAG: hypothetical protein ABEJ88_08205 [Halobacterium sp.]
MADGTSDGVESVTLEGDAAAWLAERAGELDVETGEFLERVVAAYRSAEAGDLPADLVTDDELADRLADVEDEYDEKIQDVRERVIQVKREADAKAPADHDHEELAAQASEAAAAAERAESSVESLSARVDRLDEGFENYEDVLSYLRDETDELRGRTTTLATAVSSMRESLRSLAAAEARRARVEQLQREANVEGVEEADCADCGQSVTVALLSAPECPFCGATFEGVTANSGWFSSHALETGGRPALEASAAPVGEDGWLAGDDETLEEMAAGGGEREDREPETWADPGTEPPPEEPASGDHQVVDVEEADVDPGAESTGPGPSTDSKAADTDTEPTDAGEDEVTDD